MSSSFSIRAPIHGHGSAARYQAELDNLLDVVAPHTRNSAVGLADLQLLVVGDEVVILSAGELIGPAATFWIGGNDLEHSQVGYLGFEIPFGGDTHYGWLGIATDFEGGIVVRDWAFETNPGLPITAGAVPEPNGFSLVMFMALVMPSLVRAMR